MKKQVLGVLALLMAATGCEGEDMGLMSGIGPGRVGGPAKFVAANPNPGIFALGQGQPQTLVKFQAIENLNSDVIEATPQTLTGSVSAYGDSGQAGLLIGAGFGPLVGIAKWGSGNSGEQTAEFDIPINSLTAVQGGGVLFTVVGDYLEIAARNDASVQTGAGDPTLGGTSPTLPMVGASIGVGNRSGNTPLTLTKWLAFNPAGALPAGNSQSVRVPRFARSFTVFRSDAAQTIAISVAQDGTQVYDGPYNVAANVASPEFPLASTAGFVTVKNTGAAALNALGVIFKIGL